MPAGETEIRFEGVAGGIVPQSAIVTGLPDGIVERNRDAYLLSPATLLDRSLGRRVHLRRTSRATGAVREQEAVIRSGADGAVVLQTADGFEALRCTGLPETPDLRSASRRPVGPADPVGARARAAGRSTATVTLSYLASGFDWQANYIATLVARRRADVDLFAWLTLASGDETSFANADTQAVAGRLNRERVPAREPREGGPLQPALLAAGARPATSRWSSEPRRRRRRWRGFAGRGDRRHRPPHAAGAACRSSSPVADDRPQQEELGDLKLYRIPEPVTVAANSQKQVALLQRPDVQVELVYRQRLDPTDPTRAGAGRRASWSPATARRRGSACRCRPAGWCCSPGGGRPILIGEGRSATARSARMSRSSSATAPGVTRERSARPADARPGASIVLTVDQRPRRAGALRGRARRTRRRSSSARGRLGRRERPALWTATVPANGTRRPCAIAPPLSAGAGSAGCRPAAAGDSRRARRR